MAAPPRRPRRPPELMDELVEEILLRLPLDKPACLVHAALVCKRWCRLVTDPSFRRRFHQFHHTPPMLGLIICSSHRRGNTTRFLSTSFYPSGVDSSSWFPLDARHGRILFCDNSILFYPKRMDFSVWTPATCEVHKLPGLWLPNSYYAYWKSALLCGAPGCDHMECLSSGPFTVVLVSRTMLESFTYAYVYSSVADKWSKQQASIQLTGYVEHRCTSSPLVGNAFYFLLEHNNGILEYDLAEKELSAIRLPPICSESTTIVPMALENDRLGFAMVKDDFSLCIWLRESAPTPSGGWTWTKHKVVNLKGVLPVPTLSSSPYIIAAADAVGVFVIWAGDAGVLAIDIISR